MALVLIVDDSPTEVHVLSGYLNKHGFDTAAAADGREGIEKARELKPDLILMDVVMPGVNGFQATRELARDPGTASIPIVMVTTKGLQTDKIWGMRQGAVDYLVKPVTEAQLVEKVRAALSGHD
jgi:twitching motility two-component system response regulator PilH